MKSIDRPAILGGDPAFTDPLPFNRPTLPPFSELADDFRDIIDTGLLTNGSRVAALEKRAAEICGRPVAAVSSCTSGLMLAYKLTGLSGKVIVPSFTFFATAHALFWNGLEPVFVDIDPGTWTVDPAKVEEAVTDEVSGIVAVDVFGNPAPREELSAVAARHGLKLVIDAAHSLGGQYRGRPIGSHADAEVFSLSPTKLAVAGEGGLVAGGAELIESVRCGRDYGNDGDYDCRFIGLSARMSEFHAALASASLDRLDGHVRAREQLAEAYWERLGEIPGLIRQATEPDSRPTNKDIPAFVDPRDFGLDRDGLRAALAAEGVPTRTYFDPPAHRQSAYSGLGTEALVLPVTERLSTNIICLPVFSHMKADEVERVCRAIHNIHTYADRVAAVATGPGAVTS